MENKVKIIFFSLLLVFSTGSAQTIEQLEKLAAFQATAGNMADPDILTPREEIIETKAIDELRKEQQIILDAGVDFGFTGRNDFLVAPQPKALMSPLKHFGYDYFLNTPATYAPAEDVPIPSNYILGPGDIIKIIFFGSNNNNYTLKVTRDGDIFVPELGPVLVAGLNIQDLKEVFQELVNNQLIGTKVSLTLGTLRAINIFVLGEAFQPGMYTVSALSTLTNAIFLSGGIQRTGSLRNIQLKRNGEVISTFDFYDLLLKGDTSNDQRLMSGDVIFIPPITKKVGIVGEIERPGIYELSEGETAQELIDYAGTLKAKADLKSVEIERVDSIDNGFKLIKIDTDKYLFSQLSLNDGDTLTIYPLTNQLTNAVLIKGHSPKPGFYPWKEGMRLLDLVSSKQELLPGTDMQYALIKREGDVGKRNILLHVNLEELLKSNNPDQNKFLKNRDEVIFFPSLLTTNLIKTVLSDEAYSNKDDTLAIHYIKKSIEDKAKQDASFDIPPGVAIGEEDEVGESAGEEENDKYFHYKVFDYCVLTEDEVKEVLEFLLMSDQAEFITRQCRRQLLDPLIAAIEQQTTPFNNEMVAQVYGNVRFPGKYPITDGAVYEQLLAGAGGLNSLSYLKEIEITSSNFLNNTSSKTLITQNTSSEYQAIANKPVQPLDILTIKQYTNRTDTVTIRGEVFFPGVYPIFENETFSNLIERAGGYKPDAEIKNTFFQREEILEKDLESLVVAQENLKKQVLLASTSSFGAADTELLNEILLLTEEQEPDLELLGRLVLDFDNSGNLNTEIKLKDGDFIQVPKPNQFVTISGEVQAPSSHLYRSDYNLNDYIQLSGGYSKFADSNNIYLLKANGEVVNLSSNGFFRSSKNSIDNGDTIIVPLNVRSFNGLKATAEATQIIYQMAIAAAAVNSF